MKFIILTDKTDFRILINPMMITTITSLDPIYNKPCKARVFTLGNDAWSVKETIEEIQSKIKETENIQTITWHTESK